MDVCKNRLAIAIAWPLLLTAKLLVAAGEVVARRLIAAAATACSAAAAHTVEGRRGSSWLDVADFYADRVLRQMNLV